MSRERKRERGYKGGDERMGERERRGDIRVEKRGKRGWEEMSKGRKVEEGREKKMRGE